MRRKGTGTIGGMQVDLHEHWHLGGVEIPGRLVLAPMAGVTDKPFRQLCKKLGAGLAVSEMTTSDPRLWTTRKSLKRMDHEGEPEPVSVQIAGYDPAMQIGRAHV